MAPKLQCDLVMKGGVTSGIVYPPAILELKDTYRFRCIGGTSAGAIAAAVAAAAEYGRESDRAESGFAELAAINARLAKPPFMRDLFQANRKTRPLLRTLLDAAFVLRTDSKERKGLEKWLYQLWVVVLWKVAGLAAMKNNPGSSLLGGILGAVFARLILLPHPMWGSGGARIGVAIFALACVSLGALLGALIHLALVVIFDFPRQGFGMCPGTRAGTGLGAHDRTEVLTDWLADRLDRLAGLGPDDGPLTFHHLAHKKVGEEDVSITLQMVTSNLSQQVPLLIPFATDELIFHERDMLALFPVRIVQYLKRHAGAHADEPDRHPRRTPPEGYFYLPCGDLLPVIVATRLSLSFPVLLQAVKLHVVRASALAAKDPKTRLAVEDLLPLWFSDGGISSNFPVHLFDAWLPGRPTFGINLADLPAKHLTTGPTAEARGQVAGHAAGKGRTAPSPGPESFDATRFASLGVAPGVHETVADVPDVFLPGPREGLPERWVEIKNLMGFVGQIWSTAQNHHDTTQMMLPGYRERVAQVLLGSDEGGVNLDMPEETLAKILEKGKRAGEALRKQFAPPAEGFRDHQWIRYRILMDKLETNLLKWRERGMGGNPDYFALLDQNGGGAHYHFDAAQLARAKTRMEMLALVVESWGYHTSFEEQRLLEAIRAASGSPAGSGDAAPPNASGAAPAPRPRAKPPAFDDHARVFAHGAPRAAAALRVTPLI